MFTAIYETDASAAVSHSAFGRFLPGAGRQLATICLKTIRIYRFNTHAHFIDSEKHEWKDDLQLECIYRTELLTPVKSIGVARLPTRPSVDSLVLAFDQAKVSTVCFDGAKFALETISLHDFEDEELRDGFKTEEVSPKIVVDPLQRCAATLVYGRHLAILPLTESQSIRSYTVSLRKIDSKLTNIIDIAFLHGYYEPTLLVVYEPIQTTPGRATVRYDTVNIIAISLNVKDRVHAVIWNMAGLPSTISQCYSLPLPIGGACLFGSNEIIYLNQAVPPCGLALNSDADEFTRFPFATETKSLRLTLDGCVVEVLNESEILIATRNGDLYMLILNVDISNAVKQMKIQKVFEANLPYTLTACYPGFVFLGSKLGDSLLLKYNKEEVREENGTHIEQVVTEEHDVPMDEDDLFLYSSNKPAVTKQIPVTQKDIVFKFSVIDKFMNNAPCKVLRVATANDVQAEFQNNSKDIFFDLVTASGQDQNSSLCFYQRTVRPFMLSNFEVENALELFKIDRHIESAPKYMFVALEMATKVYEFKKNTVDLISRPIFMAQETSILVGSLRNGEIVVQITPMNIVLVGPDSARTDTEILSLKIDTNFPVASASILDPYVTMLTQNGRLLLYEVEYAPKIALKRIFIDESIENLGDKNSFTAISIYKDLSGLLQQRFTDNMSTGVGVKNSDQRAIKMEPSEKPVEDDDMDDIDAMLYGNESKQKPEVQASVVESTVMEADNKEVEIPDTLGSDIIDPTTVKPSYYLLAVRENGNFCIYNLANLQMVFRVKKLHDLPEQLVHTPLTAADLEDTLNESSQNQDFAFKHGNISAKPEDLVMEIKLNGLGLNNARPVLSILVDDIVWFYELFVQDDGYKDALMVRFRRLTMSVITRSTRFMGPQGKNPVEVSRDIGRRHAFVSPYNRIGDVTNGLFISGNYPCLLVCAHGEFFLHPFIIDGPILSCCTFNDTRCPNGIIYLRAERSAIRTAYLNSDIRYDTSYPVRRICFDETIRFVVFLLRWNLYTLITCKPVQHNQLCIVTNEDKLMETYERDTNYVLPESDKFKLQLFSTFDWNFIPKSAIEFDEFETVTCCEEVLLNSESTLWGLQSYLAIGTALNYGEEVFVRGRILIYEIIDVVPEEGMPTTRHKLKCVYDKEQKGPVTSICYCNGFLLTGMAQKIFIWQFRDGQLNGVSFLDMHFYVHNLVGFRNLALACDMFRSVSLVRYQPDHKVLSLVSRDMRPFTPSPMSAQFLLDRQHLVFVLSDENGNISIFSYLPESPESRGGESLILLGSLNIGSASNGIVRVNGHANGPFLEATDTLQETQSNIICTLDGSWAVLRPISERAFRRLQILQQLMLSQVPQCAGLNPRGCRAAKPQKLLQQPKSSTRAIIDGNFVFQFMNLNTTTKAELARASGSNRYQIIDDITEFRRACTHF